MTGKCRAILEAWHEFFEQENANNPLAYSCANLSLKKNLLMKIEKQKEEVYVIQKPRILSDLSWKIAHPPVLSSDC